MDSGHITHGESLWERLDVLRDAGSHGAKTCSVMALFLKERTALENAYGEVCPKYSPGVPPFLYRCRLATGVQKYDTTQGCADDLEVHMVTL